MPERDAARPAGGLRAIGVIAGVLAALVTLGGDAPPSPVTAALWFVPVPRMAAVSHADVEEPCSTTRVDPALRQAITATAPDAVSVAAWNTDSGARLRCGAPGGLPTASVIKLDVLETLLLRHQDEHTAMTAVETAQAATMIENSDDDAATALWADVGGATGIETANRRLGTTHLVPEPNGVWGLSTTSADDQIALLHDLTAPGPLTADTRRSALDLMRQVEPDQTWGVGGVSDPGTTPAIKDGWLGVDDDAGRWAIGSIGIATVRGHQVLLAVLTQHNPDQPTGVATVEQITRAAADSVTEP